jgi:DNA (cytosine-5)-methyltransferase 1
VPAYYNEIDPFAAAWLKNLMDAGLIMAGDIDTRSIADVQPADLKGFVQCHFFAGIGGWPYALRLAGWPDDREVWTGSCPCQPLSCAGRRGGEKDERHLWPEFYRLISERRPECVFGEQVASKDGLEWLDGISLDLEELGYAVGSSDLPAAGVGAPHIRQRVFWMAQSIRAGTGRDGRTTLGPQEGLCGAWNPDGMQCCDASVIGGSVDRLAHATRSGRQPNPGAVPGVQEQARSHECLNAGSCSEVDRVADSKCCGPRRRADGLGESQDGAPEPSDETERPSRSVRLGQSDRPGPQQGREAAAAAGYRDTPEPTGCWSDYLLIPCRDNKVRRISAEPGDVPLSYGIPRDVGRMFPRLAGMAKSARHNRVGRLKGYGNAIVPQVAAEFVRAFL